ncbi:MAG: PAS domain-containing protein [Verrucomicrobia bacterium]|nr:PAS domain-containing protein [Verrucomicrobiota bacterium]
MKLLKFLFGNAPVAAQQVAQNGPDNSAAKQTLSAPGNNAAAQQKLAAATEALLNTKNELELKTLELQQTLEQLRLQQQVVRHATNGIVICDAQQPELPLTFVNPAFEHITGYVAAEVLGRNCRFLQVTNLDQPKLEQLARAMREGKSCTVILRNYRKNGKLFWNEFSVTPVRDLQGKLTHFIGILDDISERVEAEAQNKLLALKLEENQKLENLDLLTGGIANDFNNRLTTVLGNASLAKLDSPELSPVRAHLASIEEAAREAAQLCKQMLACTGKDTGQPRKLDLSAIVNEAAQLLEISVRKKAAVKFNLAKELPSIFATETQIRQAVLNLVINAAAGANTHSAVIHVITGQHYADRAFLKAAAPDQDLPPGSYVYLEVADSNSSPSATDKPRGNGLGMTAVLGIVRSHHGAITMQQTPGGPTSFRLLFPAVEGSTTAPKPKPAPPSPTNSRPWRGEGTLLVIDDDETVRMVTSLMLESYGFQVLSANDGPSGIKIYRAHATQIKAVVLDYTMPQMDGEEVFHEVRKIRPDARVLLVSGFNEGDATGRFAGKGLAGFLQKPFTFEMFKEKLRTILPEFEDKR